MNKEQWDKLPIGTVFIYNDFYYIEVKISKDKTIAVSTLLSEMYKFEEGTIFDYSCEVWKPCLFYVKPAPKWIQDMFVIKKKQEV